MPSFFRLRFPVARGKKEDIPLAESDIIRQISANGMSSFFFVLDSLWLEEKKKTLHWPKVT